MLVNIDMMAESPFVLHIKQFNGYNPEESFVHPLTNIYFVYDVPDTVHGSVKYRLGKKGNSLILKNHINLPIQT